VKRLVINSSVVVVVVVVCSLNFLVLSCFRGEKENISVCQGVEFLHKNLLSPRKYF
jgi:hypothetical protein